MDLKGRKLSSRSYHKYEDYNYLTKLNIKYLTTLNIIKNDVRGFAELIRIRFLYTLS